MGNDDDEAMNLFDARLVECLGCGGVYRKIAPARYARDGDPEARRVGRPCVECGTGEGCIVWRGLSSNSAREKTPFPFAEGMVVGGTRVGGGGRDQKR